MEAQAAGLHQPRDARGTYLHALVEDCCAVFPDGQSFIINVRRDDAAAPINVILNWTALLPR